MARPRKKLTDEQLVQVEAWASVLNQEQIADRLGMARGTFITIMKRQPEVFERYKKGKAIAISDVAGNLISQATSGNVAAAIFYLKTQAGWREADRDKDEDNEQSGSIQKIQIEVIGKDDAD